MRRASCSVFTRYYKVTVGVGRAHGVLRCLFAWDHEAVECELFPFSGL